MKKIIIAALTIAALFVGYRMVQAYNLAQYAKNNNCEWVYQGTGYGDDRDYICK